MSDNKSGAGQWVAAAAFMRDHGIAFAGVNGCRCYSIEVNTYLPIFRDSANDSPPRHHVPDKYSMAVRLHRHLRAVDEGGVRPRSGEDGASTGLHSAGPDSPPSAPPTNEEEAGDT